MRGRKPPWIYLLRVYRGELKFIAAKEVTSVEYSEWCSLLQTLYPDKLICSGLFELFLVFEIKNGCRKDPPQEHWGNLVTPGSDGILLERFIAALREHGIKVHESWYEALERKNERNGTKPLT